MLRIKNVKKDELMENIQKGNAGIVAYEEIDVAIEQLKNQIEQLEQAKKRGCGKVMVAAWHNGCGKANIAIMSPKPDSEKVMQKFYEDTINKFNSYDKPDTESKT